MMKKKLFYLIILLSGGGLYHSQVILNTAVTEQNKVVTAPTDIRFLPGFSGSSMNIGTFHAYLNSNQGGGTTPIDQNPSTGMSAGENYVFTTQCLDENCTKKTETIQYFDDLGRTKQIINIKASPTGKDVVTPVIYDGFGRQTRDYLPVPQQSTTSGAIYTQSLSPNAFPVGDPVGIYSGEKAFSEKVLETSPLDRLQQQFQVGNDWSGKPVNFGYEANKTNDQVKRFVISTMWENGATKNAISNTGVYQDNELYKNIIIDEDGNKMVEFKNKQGQTILARKVINSSQNADTYYVYNEYDQLSFVVPPLLASIQSWSQADQDNLVYEYRYDMKNRLVEKKLPGKGWEYMVYDKQDRLVATQDANLKQRGQWLYTKYDQFGRVAYTGINTGGTRVQEQSESNTFGSNNVDRGIQPFFNRQGMDVYYGSSDLTYPKSPTWVTLLSINYYDTCPSYSFNPPFPTTIQGTVTLTESASSNGRSTKGLPVMSLVKNIENDNWTKNYIYYDDKGRIIGNYSINHLGGYTRKESKLDFSGVVKATVTKHKRLASDTERVITENFTYDHQNRLLVHKHQVDNGAEEILTQNKYNELSQLESKKVGGTNPDMPLQVVDYKYNIRGWMTNINDPINLGNDLFGYKINYNKIEGSETPDAFDLSFKVLPKYNGNIAEVSWRTSTTIGDNLRRYGYVYDPLNRLLAGFYQKDTNPSAGEYFEKMEYDLNGNITRLKRSEAMLGGTATAEVIDNLKYDYSGNRLTKVIEEQIGNSKGYPYLPAHNLIEYDHSVAAGNGNMTKHLDKGIKNIVYNFLNLPFEIDISGGKLGGFSKKLEYIYRADGVKVSKIYSPMMGNIETNYLDGFQYDNSETGITSQPLAPILKFVPTSEGYFDYVQNKYIYNYTDHLGNIRLSYYLNGSSTEVLEENNYYPFGLKHQGYNGLTGNGAYQYKYNGKELQETGMYDYGARFYMPDLGRWGVVDPLTEKSRRLSTFNYAANNPIRFIDPDGRSETDWFRNSLGQLEFRDDIKSQEDLDNKGIKGNYVGETTHEGGIFYAADGWMYDDTEGGGGRAIADGRVTDIGEVKITPKSVITERNSDFSSQFAGGWHSNFARNLVNDSYTIGLSSSVVAFLGVGTTPLNFTFLTRGEPGLYFTPSVGGSIGTGIEGSAGISFSGGRFIGDSRKIKSSMLQGHSVGFSAGVGLGLDASLGANYAPLDPKNPIKGGGFINMGGQLGVGIQGSPVTGVNLQVNYQYTPIVKPIMQLK